MNINCIENSTDFLNWVDFISQMPRNCYAVTVHKEDGEDRNTFKYQCSKGFGLGKIGNYPFRDTPHESKNLPAIC